MAEDPPPKNAAAQAGSFAPEPPTPAIQSRKPPPLRRPPTPPPLRPARSAAPPSLPTPASAKAPVVPPPVSTTYAKSGRPPLAKPTPMDATRLHAPPLPPPSAPSPALDATPSAPLALLTAELDERAVLLQRGDDAIVLARIHVERALVAEVSGDIPGASVAAKAALAANPKLLSGRRLLRRYKYGRAELPTLLEHLEHEIAGSSAESGRANLIAEKARLLQALGTKQDAARQAWEQTLAHAPMHAAALKGLEVELGTQARLGATAAFDALADHLGCMAEAYASDRALAAWLHVERADVLERRLGKIAAARDALERALELDGGVGPVREALVQHVSRHGDAAALVRLLDEEALLEANPVRSARLELDAGTIANARLGEPARALRLLVRAFERSPTTEVVDLRVVDLVVRLAESVGDTALGVKARRARLAHVSDAREKAHELRLLSALSEKQGDLEQAIADLVAARALEPSDAALAEELDRLLAAAKRHEARVGLWLAEAARCDDAVERTRRLARAASLCESELEQPAEAIRHLRSAWVATPDEPRVHDALGRLLAPEPSEEMREQARTLVTFYAQAAESAGDPARRVAYLEKAALLQEDVLVDLPAAASAFDKILATEPNRRGAILGLARVSARARDDVNVARALLLEAGLAADPGARRDLRVRAAEALVQTDAARALSLVEAVLREEPAHDVGRALETRLHEDGGRWQLAADSIRARIDATRDPRTKAALWIARAQIDETRLHDPRAAVAALEAARALDASHPVPPASIAKLLADVGDLAALRVALEKLAQHARTPLERVRYLLPAAEVSELGLSDPTSAERLYAKALDEIDDELIADRLARVLERTMAPTAAKAARGQADKLQKLLATRVERAGSGPTAAGLSFRLARLLVQGDADAASATAILEALLADHPKHVAALRESEGVARAVSAWPALSRALTRQSEVFQDVRARRGALWGLAAVEEWHTGEPPTRSLKSLLELDPTDAGALEGIVRIGLSTDAKDEEGRAAVLPALRVLGNQATDDEARWFIELSLGLLLEASSREEDGRESLAHYRAALAIDPRSVCAAYGVLRLAARFGDADGTLSASISLADLAPRARDRAAHLLTAANIVLGRGGDHGDRARGVTWLERGLREDPDSVVIAGRLATLRLEDGQPEALIDAFRDAMARAHATSIIRLGAEIARIGRDVSHDLNVGVEAMRKVRTAAPDHVPSLKTLAELYIAERSWPEAVEVLEHITAVGGADDEAKLGAYFSLSTIYDRVLARPKDAERALLQALAIDPTSPRALGELVQRRRAARVGGADVPAGEREATVDMIRKLARVEQDTDKKSELLLELADLCADLGDRKEAERALVEAVTRATSQDKALGRLAAFHEGALPAYAAALAAVIELGKGLGRVEATWLALLGQLEVDHLDRVRDGIQHLQRATQMDPRLYEARRVLAQAYARAEAHEESARTLLDLLVPDARPLLSLGSPLVGLRLLERELASAGRAELAMVAAEVRAIAGDLDDGKHSSLRARRLGPPSAASLDRTSILQHLFPKEGRHVLIQVAGAIAGAETKMLRTDVERLGISPKSRIGSRSGHPTRTLLDRVARTLGVADVELVIAASVGAPRLVVNDEPWVVVPASFVDLSEPVQLAGLSRVLAPAAFGVAWIDEVSADHMMAVLVAAARRADAGYAQGALDESVDRLIEGYDSALARALSRSQRRALEELAPSLSSAQARPPRPDHLQRVLAQARARTAFVVTGDLLATIDDARAWDGALAQAVSDVGAHALVAILTHPVTSDAFGFAMSGEATALRRRVGSVWMA
jgi:tetratricopeptide (TPR) repeat protein